MSSSSTKANEQKHVKFAAFSTGKTSKPKLANDSCVKDLASVRNVTPSNDSKDPNDAKNQKVSPSFPIPAFSSFQNQTHANFSNLKNSESSRFASNLDIQISGNIVRQIQKAIHEEHLALQQLSLENEQLLKKDDTWKVNHDSTRMNLQNHNTSSIQAKKSILKTSDSVNTNHDFKKQMQEPGLTGIGAIRPVSVRNQKAIPENEKKSKKSPAKSESLKLRFEQIQKQESKAKTTLQHENSLRDSSLRDNSLKNNSLRENALRDNSLNEYSPHLISHDANVNYSNLFDTSIAALDSNVSIPPFAFSSIPPLTSFDLNAIHAIVDPPVAVPTSLLSYLSEAKEIARIKFESGLRVIQAPKLGESTVYARASASDENKWSENFLIDQLESELSRLKKEVDDLKTDKAKHTSQVKLKTSLMQLKKVELQYWHQVLKLCNDYAKAVDSVAADLVFAGNAKLSDSESSHERITRWVLAAEKSQIAHSVANDLKIDIKWIKLKLGKVEHDVSEGLEHFSPLEAEVKQQVQAEIEKLKSELMNDAASKFQSDLTRQVKVDLDRLNREKADAELKAAEMASLLRIQRERELILEEEKTRPNMLIRQAAQEVCMIVFEIIQAVG